MKANPGLQGEIVILLNKEGPEFSHATGKSKLQWRAYTRYKETPHRFVPDVSSSGSTAIPKRVMSSQPLEDPRSLFKAQIPQKVTNPMDSVRQPT